jgi:hypothetical protein
MKAVSVVWTQCVFISKGAFQTINRKYFLSNFIAEFSGANWFGINCHMNLLKIHVRRD